jgi:uncharacterized membrane protein
MNKTRLEAFSDGVLAIIITIMVLEIKMPEDASWASLSKLTHVFMSYLLSFVYVGIYWGNHHHMLHTVRQVNSSIIWANMNLLFWLSLVPLATGWMGHTHFAANSVALYALLLLVCGIAFTILQLTIMRASKLSRELQEAFAGLRTKGIISVAAYGCAIPLAFFNTVLSGVLFVSVAIIWLIPDRKIERALKQQEHQND